MNGRGNFLYELENVLEFSSGTLNGVVAIILTIVAIVSAIQCFFGYKIFKFWIGVIGFVVFGILGAVLGALAFKGSAGAAIIFGLICGILGAFLAMKLYKLGVFIQCFGTGFLVGIVLGGAILQTDIGPAMALAIVFGIIFGIVGVILVKPVIIISTGFSGGMTLGLCLAALFKGNSILGVLLGIIISICGVLYQFYSNKNLQKPTVSQNNNISTNKVVEDENVFHNTNVGLEITTTTEIETEIEPLQTTSKPNKLAEDTKIKIDELKDGLQKKIRYKIEADSREISEEESQLSIVNIFKGLEGFAYSNKILKVIMPFVEYVLYIVTGIFCMKGLFAKNISSISMFDTLFLGIITLLCVVKGKKKSIAISFALIAIFQFIGMSRIHAFDYLPGKYVFKFLLEEVIILAVAAFAAYSVLSKNKPVSEEDINGK